MLVSYLIWQCLIGIHFVIFLCEGLWAQGLAGFLFSMLQAVLIAGPEGVVEGLDWLEMVAVVEVADDDNQGAGL